MSRVAVLIDGSNFVNCLARASLGFPALGPFLRLVADRSDLVFARFYYAPLQRQPFRGQWQRFEAQNRGVDHLEFWHGHRDANGREKEVDVALAVDLVLGAALDRYDRAIVVGGDGDHRYAIGTAGTIKPILVALVEGQRASAVRGLARDTRGLHAQGRGVKYREFTEQELLERGVCASGAFAPSPWG